MLLNNHEINCIIEKGIHLMETAGIQICLPEARTLLEKAGCCVDGDVVRIPAQVTKRAIETTPAKWSIFDKDGLERMQIGKGNTYYGTADVATSCLDYKTNKKRAFTLQDTRDAAKVINNLDNIDFVCPFGTPTELDYDRATPESFRALMEITTKPIAFVAHNLENMKEVYKIAADEIGGMDNLREKPFIFTLLEPCSPYVFPKETLEKILWESENNMPFCFNSAVSLGATAPVTTAGALTLCLAEELTALVIAQLNNPGCPVALGACIGILDMKRGTFAVGTPEYILGNAAFVQITRALHIPAWTNGCCTQGKTIDEYSIAELMMSTFMPNFVHADIVYDAGYLESGKLSSIEMCAMADEFIGYVRRMRQGIRVNDESLAIDLLNHVGISGNFLDKDHTFENFHDELWTPRFMDRDAYAAWEAKGAKTMRQEVQEMIGNVLNNTVK
ncbi:trimethylamine methyltransferase family protein [Lawsonibacter sp. OA9]|uniref:trimethylamine methyltransferase family protein n=1 Tax=Oscillospiraceae TaxID=216572 RepID=UPI001F059FCA|nr:MULTISPECIES: trimethylamine methyltransferase family protein [Oscillospiraceae]MCH1978290.1 trimethylamine methyltransferase family protein [Lawsonibacter sp. OA9]MCH1981444.1 trimethylamine methyltransferase family protein [Ruminococcus sp. OA3]